MAAFWRSMPTRSLAGLKMAVRTRSSNSATSLPVGDLLLKVAISSWISASWARQMFGSGVFFYLRQGAPAVIAHRPSPHIGQPRIENPDNEQYWLLRRELDQRECIRIGDWSHSIFENYSRDLWWFDEERRGCRVPFGQKS